MASSQVRPGEGFKAYSDLPIVSELRGLANRARVASKVASRSSDETLKWLSWPDFLKVVQQLRLECAGTILGGPVSRSAVPVSAVHVLTCWSCRL